MYPLLASSYALKGSESKWFIFDIKTGREFPLTNSQYFLFRSFNGTKKLESLAKDNNIKLDLLKKFVNKQKRLGFLKILPNRLSKRDILKSQSPKLDYKPYLREVHLDITSKCNLSCRHCYQYPLVQKNSNIKNNLTTNELKKLIDQMAYDLGVTRLVISGGEPFLRKDLFKILEYSAKRHILPSTIFTNGSINIFDSLRDYIKKAKHPLTIAVSLDGNSKFSHEIIRGRGSYKPTIKFIEKISDLSKKRKSVKLFINTMVHKYNLEELPLLYKRLCKYKVFRWRLAMPRLQGKFIPNARDLSEAKLKVFTVYKKLIKNYFFKNIWRNQTENKLQLQIECIFKSEFFRKKTIQLFERSTPCCAYKLNALAIKPNGDVVPCPSFINKVIGNIRTAKLKTIWTSNKMQFLKKLPVSLLNECQSCKLVKFCGGGCRKVALDETGSLYKKDSSTCEIYNFFYTDILPLIKSHGIKTIPYKKIY